MKTNYLKLLLLNRFLIALFQILNNAIRANMSKEGKGEREKEEKKKEKRDILRSLERNPVSDHPAWFTSPWRSVKILRAKRRAINSHQERKRLSYFIIDSYSYGLQLNYILRKEVRGFLRRCIHSRWFTSNDADKHCLHETLQRYIYN